MIETSAQDGRQNIDSQDIDSRPSQSRALVALDAGSRSRTDERPSAPFVAQLIACARRLPAFRTAGRAAPETGARSYRLIDLTPSRAASRNPRGATGSLSILI